MLSVLVAAAMSPCPALASIGRPAAPLPAQRCRADACVRAAYGARAHARRGRRNGARVTRLVAARAWGSPAAVATKDEADTPWWKQHDEHWTEATTEDEFWELVNGAEESVVLVDWYATWCKGCKRMLPELSKLVGTYGDRIKFVKANSDSLKALAKAQHVKALPQVGLYRPGHGRLLAFQAVPSKMKIIKANLNTVLDSPGKYFKLDPNGYAMVLDEDPTPEITAARKKAKALAASTGSLFEHLMATANGGSASPEAIATKQAPLAKPADGDAAARNGSGAPSTSAPAGTAAERKQRFLREWGDEYGYGGAIDELYRSEVGCRLPEDQHYLDYTGSALYCRTPLQAAFNDLQEHVFGNPHSVNPSSSLTAARVDNARDMILEFFNADPGEYQVIFTKGATGALKITGETFPWSEGSVFRYTRENHNSVLGVREYALQHDARFQAVEEEWVEDWISGHREGEAFLHPTPGNAAEPTLSLFALPAEENFSGRLYPLRWIREIQGMSTAAHKWKVLLDAAAFVPTQPLDLSVYPADFVSISFYKMLGFPTGLGALLMRTENVDLMRKTFWGGGTVALASSAADFHVLKCKPSDKFEDGTLAFLDVIALQHGFDFLKDTLGGVGAVQKHAHALTRHLYARLSALRHGNGTPLAVVFGAHGHANPLAAQGAIVNFEVQDPSRHLVSYRVAEQAAADAGFHIRAGILCNPGAAYRDVGVSEEEVATLAGEKEGCDDEVDFISVQRPADDGGGGVTTDADVQQRLGGAAPQLGHPGEVALKWVRKPLGSVRVSLGYMSTWEDVDAFVEFLAATFTDKPAATGDAEA